MRLRRQCAADAVDSAFEIARIGKEAGLRRLPSQFCLRALARSPVAHRSEMGKPSKVLAGLRGSLADNRNTQPPADHRRVLGRGAVSSVTSPPGDRLTNCGDSISSIALSLGYESESVFSTAFKRVIGCSPRQYSRGRTASALQST